MNASVSYTLPNNWIIAGIAFRQVCTC